MPRGRPVDPKTRIAVEEACREAIASGVGSRNSIARAFEIGPATVSKICAEAQPPIVWDRSATQAAVKAHQLDAKARRQRLAETVLDDIDRVRERFFETELQHSAFSVALGITRWESPATPSELRDLATTFGILIDKHMLLARFDSDDRDLAAVDQWMAHVMGEDQG